MNKEREREGCYFVRNRLHINKKEYIDLIKLNQPFQGENNDLNPCYPKFELNCHVAKQISNK